MSDSLVDAAFTRIREWEHLTLADTVNCGIAAAFVTPPSYLLDAVRTAEAAQRSRLLRALREPSDSPSTVLATRFTNWLLRNNQFGRVDPDIERRIVDTYDRGFTRALHVAPHTTARDLAELLDDHAHSLQGFIAEIIGPHARDVVCAEYRPTTQLAVLGLATDTLRNPVFDIGCGEYAALVQYLRSAGFDAHGIDRRTEAHMRADWLDYDPGVSRWGTIVAHQSFTLHFLHHHHRAGGADTAQLYARAFMRYLFSLTVGGTFAYAPSIPFFEGVLPAEQWLVDPTVRMLDGVTVTATRITRRY